MKTLHHHTEPMSLIDGFWHSLDQPTNLMVITAIFEFEECLDYQRLKETLEKRWLVFARFKKKLVKPLTVIGKSRWALDPNFDIRSHVSRVALPGDGGKKELEEMISSLAIMPLDPSKPLWQVHLIENYGNGCAVFWRIHHCIADGIALNHVLLSMTDLKPDQEISESDPLFSGHNPAQGHKFTGLGEKLAPNKMKQVLLPWLDKNNITSIKNFSESLVKHFFMPADTDTGLKGALGVRKAYAWSDTLMLADIKTVGKKLDATVNDIVVSAVTGALRRYLVQEEHYSGKLDLSLSMPVNIRPAGTEFELGNQFGVASLTLPVEIKNPLLRLQIVKQHNDAIKSSPEPMTSNQFFKVLGLLPTDWARKAVAYFGNKSSAVFSNVCGPGQAIYFAGKKIKNIMFWVPRTGLIGMGISIFTYNGRVTLGIATDEGLVPNPHLLIQYFEMEMEKLVKMANRMQSPVILECLKKYSHRQARGDADKTAANKIEDRYQSDISRLTYIQAPKIKMPKLSI